MNGLTKRKSPDQPPRGGGGHPAALGGRPRAAYLCGVLCLLSHFGLRIPVFTTLALLLASASLGLSAQVPLGTAGGDPYSIVNSKHNLSISGPGTVRASTEGEI